MPNMKDLLRAGVHFGHQARYWQPKMAPYIYGTHNKIHIIDLEKTLPALHEALDFMGRVVANHGRVLFVGTKWAARDVIAEQAKRCGMPYVNHRWLGGMLTNYKTVRKSIRRLSELQAASERGEFERLTKKERLQIGREIVKLDRSLGGIQHMGGLPDALFVIDVGYEDIAVLEARKLGIPVIGIVDTNRIPDGIDYVIPGNDDARRAIELYTTAAADVINASKVEAKDLSQDTPKPSKKRATKPKAAVTKKAEAPAEEAAPAKAAPVETPEAPAAPETAAPTESPEGE